MKSRRPSNARSPKKPSGLKLLSNRLGGGRLLGLLVASSVMVIGAIAANYPALLSGKIVDQILKGDADSFSRAIPFLGALLASYLVREASVILRKYLVERAACDLERDELRSLSLFLTRLDLSAFWGQRIGGLNVRIHRSLEGLVKLVKLLFLDLLPTLALSGVAFVMAAHKSLLVVSIMAAIFVSAMVLTFIQVATQNGIRRFLFNAKEDVSGNLTEVLMGLDYVRAAGGMDQEEARTKELSERLRKQEFLHHKWMMSFDGLKQLLEGLGLVFVVGIGAWQVANGIISNGDVLTLALLYGAVAAPLRELHRIIDEGSEGLLKVQQLAGLYTLLADTGIPGSTALDGAMRERPAVVANGLGLALQANDGATHDVLTNVDLSVRRGEWVGFAGGSGSGKTTLLRTIIGLTPRYTGTLEAFGVEVRDIVKAEYWSKLGYVSQSPHVIKGTLRENLLYGNVPNDPDDEALIDALRSAGLQDRFAVRGVASLDDDIEEQGRNLSGGERQRLAIARIFLRKPDLIVLDEATSALDYENEWKLIQELRRRFRGVTALVVAHRMEALKETDRIIVMKAGQIVDEGPFDALARREGEFQKIANLPKPPPS